MNKFTHNKIINILAFIVLLASVAVGVALSGDYQSFRSSAQVDVGSAFELKDPQGNIINCNGESCPTDEDSINIKLKDIEILENLK